jgi:hypothetical protein
MTTVVAIHGTPASSRRCKDGPRGAACETCREASARYIRRMRAKKRELLAADPSIRPHGNISTYQNWGCRCDECKAVGYAKRRQYPPYTEQVRQVPRPKPFGREWVQ